MASRRRVSVPGSNGGRGLPRTPRQVERGGRRAPFDPNDILNDQISQRRLQGGFARGGEFIEGTWTQPNPRRMPQSKGDVDFPGYRGPGPNPFPRYDPFREHEEADLFAGSDNAQ